MNRSLVGAVLVVVVFGLVLGGLVSVVPDARAASSSSSSVTGSVQGPHVIAIGGNARLTLNATGGPAFAANGTLVGNLTYVSSLAGADLTGVTVSPASGTFFSGANQSATLTVGATPELLTITFEISSVYQQQNSSTNLTYTVNVVQPYVVTATIYNSGTTTVLPFSIDVELDGKLVGNVTVPSIAPKGQYNLSFQYATLGLSSGDHTFTLSLANEHGLVTFAHGALSYSTTIYIPPGAPDNAAWYLLGGVAFVGVLFIFMTRVAARRRGAARK